MHPALITSQLPQLARKTIRIQPMDPKHEEFTTFNRCVIKHFTVEII